MPQAAQTLCIFPIRAEKSQVFKSLPVRDNQTCNPSFALHVSRQ
jgi:hypothetical protein